MLISIIILIISIILFAFSLSNIYKKYTYNKEIEKENNKLKEIKNNLETTITNLNKQHNNLKETIEDKIEKISNLNEKLNNMENTVQQSFSNYCDILDSEYKIKEEEYNKLLLKLEHSFDTEHKKYAEELCQVTKDLDKMKQTRAAAMEANRKEKEIEENIQFYSISIETKDKNDIQVLNRIKKDLNNPRILCMLIWQSFFRDKITELCNNILGVKTVCGIYKITNQLTKESYIGQSVNIRRPLETACKMRTWN